MRPSWWAAVLVVVTSVSMMPGCYKATFVRPAPPAGDVEDEWYSFWVFGLVGEQEIDIKEYCRDGQIRMIRTGGNVGTDFVTFLTLGIYAPRKVYVQCARKKKTEVGQAYRRGGLGASENDGGAGRFSSWEADGPDGFAVEPESDTRTALASDSGVRP